MENTELICNDKNYIFSFSLCNNKIEYDSKYQKSIDHLNINHDQNEFKNKIIEKINSKVIKQKYSDFYSNLNTEVRQYSFAFLVNIEKNVFNFFGLFGDYNRTFHNYSINNPIYDSYNNGNTFHKYNPDEYDNKVTDQNNVELLKELELFTSLNRPLETKIDENFKNEFLHKMFDYVDILGSTQGHIYHKEPKSSTAFLLKRLKNEFDKFPENLPCNFSSSYFIRADMNYPQFIKVLIAGSRGTPYEHGLFEYDIYIPINYPIGIPKCTLRTTGDGRIRFNPNLYNNGYVCLSLLGTWAGSSIETWDPKTSSLVQLILSLSSLVMNDRIIENEPGFENTMKSTEGIYQNEGYANVVRFGNITYSMIQMLRIPAQIFSNEIREYFSFKGKEIILDLKTWLDRSENAKCLYTGLTYDHNMIFICRYNMQNNYQKNIKNSIETLKQLLNFPTGLLAIKINEYLNKKKYI